MGRKPRGRGKRRFQHNRNFIRKNQRIRVPEVRVIGPAGEMLGVMSPEEAMVIAKKHSLDLVEVAPTARPPVCRILEFGKYKYELSKNKKNKDKSGGKRIKEAKFRPRIEKHDYETKLRRAEKFLHQGFKLKLTMMMRGRELEHVDIGFERLRQAVKDLSGVGRPDDELKRSGRFIAVNLSPVPKNQRILKFNTDSEAETEEDDDHDEEDEDLEEDEDIEEEDSDGAEEDSGDETADEREGDA
ncbi:MAG: translation initiation factor IF-3 [Opitutales bacterium]